ncbi:molybdopterin molybdotransferase MoeA [bacterium]|nr:molybdopterin molybdotransferase MoeA [candidate division CSSED10-310 bacterium]
MIPLEQALSISEHVLSTRVTGEESIPVRDALNRHVARDLHSRIDLPPFDKSAMDGFAIPPDDPSKVFTVIGTIQAGDVAGSILTPGTCYRIMTGAPVPHNTGYVVPVEHTRMRPDGMMIVTPSTTKHICRRGEDIRSGDLLATRGNRIDAQMLAVLISGGIEIVPVFRRPRVTVFSTGNELVTAMSEWGPGKIFDSNGPMMRSLFLTGGAEIVECCRLQDDPEETEHSVRRAIPASDIIAFSGGVSEGAFDFIPDSLVRCDFSIHFSRLRVKPGKPMTFATHPDCLAFGFPGNPVSTYVMYHLFALPAIIALQGGHTRFRTIPLPMDAPWSRKKTERLEFIPARLVTAPDRTVRIRTVPYHGSAHLSALSHCDGFALIDPGISAVDAGRIIPFWPITLRSYEEIIK